MALVQTRTVVKDVTRKEDVRLLRIESVKGLNIHMTYTQAKRTMGVSIKESVNSREQANDSAYGFMS